MNEERPFDPVRGPFLGGQVFGPTPDELQMKFGLGGGLAFQPENPKPLSTLLLYDEIPPRPSYKVEDDDPRLLQFANLALDKYNSEKNTCYKCVQVEKNATWDSVGLFYRFFLSFQAKIADGGPETFAAMVCESGNELEVSFVFLEDKSSHV